MKRRKLLFLCLIVSMMSVVLAGCGSQTGDKQAEQKATVKTITLGTNAEFAPFEYMNSDNEVDGFDIALMKAIGEKAGFNISITNMEFKSLPAALKTGGIDLIASGMTITDERKQSVDFSDGYYEATQSIIVPTDSSVQSMQDLEGKSIAVQEGTTGDLMVTPGTKDSVLKKSSVKRFKKGSDAVIELVHGGVDAVVIDKAPAEQYVKLNSDKLRSVENSGEPEVYGFAVQKGDTELAAMVNKGLKAVQDDGTYEKLLAKYISGVSTNDITSQSESNASVPAAAPTESDNFFLNLIYKIRYVFIDTNGYILLLKGLGVTLGIAFAASVVGIALGFLIALMRLSAVHKKRKTIASRIAGVYIDILRGTPVIVQLMIIYMVIFQNKFGIVAAILTFGINSGAYVAENVRAGIMAVDSGQMEAGRAMGFSYKQTMRHIIMPQAIKNILPAIGNELVTLVKETSVVGYVAIVDLTKASDFIISRTYETFLPLIAIAIIYYIVVKIMSKALAAFERRLRTSDQR